MARAGEVCVALDGIGDPLRRLRLKRLLIRIGTASSQPTRIPTVPLVFLLPALLLSKKDAEPRIEAEEVPPLKTALQE